MADKRITDRDCVRPSERHKFNNLDKNLQDKFSGVGNTKSLEVCPNFIQCENEHVIAHDTNAFIVMGKDRPASKISGYGGIGDTQAGSIDMVVGRGGPKPKNTVVVSGREEPTFVDPDFGSDAARIHMSQKTDIDKNFGIVAGKVGISKARSGIGMKADSIRLVGREGIKLVTRTDFENSQGGSANAVRGIDLIAGNQDEGLQPIPKGKNLQKALTRMVKQTDALSGIMSSMLVIQMKLNKEIMMHFHHSPFFAAATTPSGDLIPAGIRALIDQLDQVMVSIKTLKINGAGIRKNYLLDDGEFFINSPFNNTN